MPVTTSESLRENQGQMCNVCTKRSPLCTKMGAAWVCPDCDPREHPIKLMPADAPVERGRG